MSLAYLFVYIDTVKVIQLHFSYDSIPWNIYWTREKGKSHLRKKNAKRIIKLPGNRMFDLLFWLWVMKAVNIYKNMSCQHKVQIRD